jgi:hypothetical protein
MSKFEDILVTAKYIQEVLVDNIIDLQLVGTKVDTILEILKEEIREGIEVDMPFITDTNLMDIHEAIKVGTFMGNTILEDILEVVMEAINYSNYFLPYSR